MAKEEIIYKHMFGNGSAEYRNEDSAHDKDSAYIRADLIFFKLPEESDSDYKKRVTLEVNKLKKEQLKIED